VSGFADVGGACVVRLAQQVPMAGAWTAAVTLDGEPSRPGGIVALNVAGVAWQASVWRWTPHHGVTRALLVGGVGWSREVPGKFYGSGARLSTVVGDLAREVSERVTVVADRSLSPSFTRCGGPASRVLHELVSEWHVQADGVTRLGPRVAGRVTSAFDVTAAGCGRYTVATEHPGDWLPGRAFPIGTEDATIVGAVVHLRDGALRVDVLVR
jgi:hypothetical protein